VTADGVVGTVQVNAIAPALLTNLLKTQLLAAPKPRVVYVGSANCYDPLGWPANNQVDAAVGWATGKAPHPIAPPPTLNQCVAISTLPLTFYFVLFVFPVALFHEHRVFLSLRMLCHSLRCLSVDCARTASVHAHTHTHTHTLLHLFRTLLHLFRTLPLSSRAHCFSLCARTPPLSSHTGAARLKSCGITRQSRVFAKKYHWMCGLVCQRVYCVEDTQKSENQTHCTHF
jgi:hypothetical protein